MRLTHNHAGLSHLGQVRKVNEDRWATQPSLGMFLVADGIGGHAAGDVAAEIVAETLPGQIEQKLVECPDATPDRIAEQIRRALCELSNMLVEQTQGEIGLDGLGSTAVVLLVRDNHAFLAHMGDSRAYLWRKGCIKRLTKDHTIVQMLVDRGEIDTLAARVHPARGQLTRFVGMPGVPLPEVTHCELEPCDRILLCTDGLTNMLSDHQLGDLLGANDDVEELSRQLIKAANDAGGDDNATVLVIEMEESKRLNRVDRMA